MRACAAAGGDMAPMMLALGPEEISALRGPIDGYLSLDVGGGDHGVLKNLHGLFVSWERRHAR